MKKLKYLLFLFIIFITPNVFAYEYDVTNNITAPTGPATGGHYLGLEIYNSGSQNNYTVNTRYSGTLSEIIYNLPLPSNAGQCFTTNMEYTITMEMATSDWRNHFSTPFVSWYSGGSNWKTSNVVFVSMKKIYFKFKIPTTETSCIDFVYVKLRSPSVSSTAFTGVTNWNLSKITLTDGYSSSGGSGGGSGGGSNIDPNQNVIDNANQNTQDIIDNNNQNTQIITDTIKDTFNNCQKVDKLITADDIDPSLVDMFLTSDGSVDSSGGYGVSNYIDILPNANYSLTSNDNVPNNVYFCWYDSSKAPLHCTKYAQQSSWSFHTGDTARYIRFTIRSVSSSPTYQLHLESAEICSSKIDDVNKGINDVNDTLNNSNIDNGVGSDFFNNFSSQDFGLSQIITLPLTTIQSLANTSCVSLNIPIPFTNSTIPLPCMTQVYQTYIPTIFNIWQVVSFGIIAYFICIDIVHLVKGFKDPDSDKVEVLDL